MISKVAAACVAFASIAFGATLTVHAADVFNWTGGQTGVANTEESPYNIWNAANWDATDWGETVPTGDKYLHLSVQKKTYINSTSGNRIGNDFCPNSGDFVFTGPLKFYSFKPGSVAGQDCGCNRALFGRVNLTQLCIRQWARFDLDSNLVCRYSWRISMKSAKRVGGFRCFFVRSLIYFAP